MSIENINFICGCGHSGNSLIANMMAAHPDVYIPLRETEIFLKRPLEAEGRLMALRREAEADGKRFLAEKTPRHIRHVGFIRTMVPGARFIVPVRDGRDVAASIARRVGGSPRPGVNRWLRDTGTALSERDRPDVHVYRHEDMVADPESTLRAICAFAEIPFAEEMLRYHEEERLWSGVTAVKDKSPVGKTHRYHRTWQINQPIFNSSGQWRETLTDADVAPLLTGRPGEVMRAFGYLE